MDLEVASHDGRGRTCAVPHGTNSPCIIRIQLGGFDISEGTGAGRLQFDAFLGTAGNQMRSLRPAELFRFITPDGH